MSNVKEFLKSEEKVREEFEYVPLLLGILKSPFSRQKFFLTNDRVIKRNSTFGQVSIKDIHLEDILSVSHTSTRSYKMIITGIITSILGLIVFMFYPRSIFLRFGGRPLYIGILGLFFIVIAILSAQDKISNQFLKSNGKLLTVLGSLMLLMSIFTPRLIGPIILFMIGLIVIGIGVMRNKQEFRILTSNPDLNMSLPPEHRAGSKKFIQEIRERTEE